MPATAASASKKISRDLIPIGRENAITRRELAAQLGMTDRDAREVVAQLRVMDTSDPYVICSSSRAPAGYWRTDDPAEIDRFIRETRNRAISTFQSLRDAKRFKNLTCLEDTDERPLL